MDFPPFIKVEKSSFTVNTEASELPFFPTRLTNPKPTLHTLIAQPSAFTHLVSSIEADIGVDVSQTLVY